jgi:hypothetical protein
LPHHPRTVGAPGASSPAEFFERADENDIGFR